MNLIKAAMAGLLASLAMYLVAFVGVQALDVAPFAVPAYADWFERWEMNIGGMALLLHFFYGMFWSMILVTVSGPNTDVKRGLLTGFLLWLLMLVIYAIIIGWDAFGYGDPDMDPDMPLVLTDLWVFLGGTLLLHLTYGLIIGWLNHRWTRYPRRETHEFRRYPV